MTKKKSNYRKVILTKEYDPQIGDILTIEVKHIADLDTHGDIWCDVTNTRTKVSMFSRVRFTA